MSTTAWLWLALTPVASAVQRCPNLSGNFVAQGEDGRVYTSIVQHGCDRLEMVIKSSYLGKVTKEKHVLSLDGVERADSPWFGGSERYRSSARFAGSELRVTITDNGTTHTEIYSLNPTGDLVEWTPAPDPIKVVARRQK